MGSWLAAHKFLLIIIPCSMIIIAAGVVSTLILIDAANSVAVEEPEPEPDPDPVPIVKYFSRLTGFPIAGQEQLNAPATCVMIENSPDARPQSGLTAAGVVYEAEAEGGITRFMAVYQQHDLPMLLGPVRSLRLYYAHWARPYNCAIAHWGGADDALWLVRNTPGFRDADQSFNPSAYWRIKNWGRYAPHDGYTNAERQIALNAARGFGPSEFVGFPRAVGGVLPTRSEVPATAINIKMVGAYYSVRYAYDAASNSYLRSHESGGAHMDKDVNAVVTQNAPKVVIAIRTAEEGRAGGYYMNTVAVGTGAAYIFQNGEYIEGTWTKSSILAELEFHDAAGKPIVFVPGQVWITAVVKNRPITWQ